jgi:hypothetical protein
MMNKSILYIQQLTFIRIQHYTIPVHFETLMTESVNISLCSIASLLYKSIYLSSPFQKKSMNIPSLYLSTSITALK